MRPKGPQRSARLRAPACAMGLMAERAALVSWFARDGGYANLREMVACNFSGGAPETLLLTTRQARLCEGAMSAARLRRNKKSSVNLVGQAMVRGVSIPRSSPSLKSTIIPGTFRSLSFRAAFPNPGALTAGRINKTINAEIRNGFIGSIRVLI